MILPLQSALSQGADLAVQSTHKVLGSMGQSSMLHTQGTLVDRPRVSRALQTLQVSILLPSRWSEGLSNAVLVHPYHLP